ncbi:MAG: RNA polymerase sigma factor [Chloroflexi bacterium]|nr:RNA polymerase sigma factor [Chloroflexota bacterium]
MTAVRDLAPPHTIDGRHDDDLVAAARRDLRAFGLLYERHMPRVYDYLRARGATPEDAADLTAMAFERAMTHLADYRANHSGVLPWLLRIARNAWIDQHRRRRFGFLPIASALDASDPDPGPDALAIANERDRWVRSMVAGLPEPVRDAIALRYAAGLTGAEIAPIIGKSEAATRKLLARGIQTIRGRMTDDDPA